MRKESQEDTREKTAYNPSKIVMSYSADTSATLLNHQSPQLNLNGWIQTQEPGWIGTLGEVATAIFDGLCVIAMMGTMYKITDILFSLG